MMNYPTSTQISDFHDWSGEYSMARDYTISLEIDRRLTDLEVATPSKEREFFDRVMEEIDTKLDASFRLNRGLLQLWQCRNAKEGEKKVIRDFAVQQIVNVLNEAIIRAVVTEVESEY
jgi:hypothetical protein